MPAIGWSLRDAQGRGRENSAVACAQAASEAITLSRPQSAAPETGSVRPGLAALWCGAAGALAQSAGAAPDAGAPYLYARRHSALRAVPSLLVPGGPCGEDTLGTGDSHLLGEPAALLPSSPSELGQASSLRDPGLQPML